MQRNNSYSWGCWKIRKYAYCLDVYKVHYTLKQADNLTNYFKYLRKGIGLIEWDSNQSINDNKTAFVLVDREVGCRETCVLKDEKHYSIQINSKYFEVKCTALIRRFEVGKRRRVKKSQTLTIFTVGNKQILFRGSTINFLVPGNNFTAG